MKAYYKIWVSAKRAWPQDHKIKWDGFPFVANNELLIKACQGVHKKHTVFFYRLNFAKIERKGATQPDLGSNKNFSWNFCRNNPTKSWLNNLDTLKTYVNHNRNISTITLYIYIYIYTPCPSFQGNIPGPV